MLYIIHADNNIFESIKGIFGDKANTYKETIGRECALHTGTF